MSKDSDYVVSSMLGNVIKAMEKEHGKTYSELISEYEKELQDDPELFAETYAERIDWSYREFKNYTKTLSYAHALPKIREQIFRYPNDQIYKIRECISAFDGVAGSFWRTGSINEEIVCRTETVSILETLYNCGQELWWEDYVISLSYLYLAYFDIKQYKEALPLINQCITLNELHYIERNPELYKNTYMESYNDLLYAFDQMKDHESFVLHMTKAKKLFPQTTCETDKENYSYIFTN